MIHVDATELRSDSRFLKHVPDLYPLFGYHSEAEFIKATKRSNLETLTGADVMLTNLGLPISLTMLPRHIEAGAVLIQLKFGRDLPSSLGERMKDSLYRMRELRAVASQCVLMYVGSLSCGRDGVAMIDGKAGRPKRSYTQVTSAIWKWCRRGGVYYPVSASALAPTLKSMEMDIGRGKEEFWPSPPPSEDYSEDVLEGLERVGDWRVAFATLSKRVGPVRATALRDAMLEAGAADVFIQALLWAASSKEERERLKVPRIKQWGDTVFDGVREAVFGRDVVEGMEIELVVRGEK